MSALLWTSSRALPVGEQRKEIREVKICDRRHSMKQQLLLYGLWNSECTGRALDQLPTDFSSAGRSLQTVNDVS